MTTKKLVKNTANLSKITTTYKLFKPLPGFHPHFRRLLQRFGFDICRGDLPYYIQCGYKAPQRRKFPSFETKGGGERSNEAEDDNGGRLRRTDADTHHNNEYR